MKSKTKYKLFNTDGKTFFDFRSNPDSRCEAFTVSYLDDGTVVMSGDYGTLCWKRNYHRAEEKDFRRDYGFPNKDTNIGYFDEKVCQFGVNQKVRAWTKEKAEKDLKEFIKEDKDSEYAKKFKDYLKNDFRFVENFEEVKFYQDIQEIYCDVGEYEMGTDYTEQFKFMFQLLKGVSKQILKAVEKND